MLIEVTAKQYRQKFTSDPHPFISEKFLELNSWKVDKIVRLVPDNDKVSLGLVAGIKNGKIMAPFSAPFGGFHYRNEQLYVSEIEYFLEELKEYAKTKNLYRIFLSLPPSIYQKSFNAKVVNTLIRLGYKMLLPDITCWVKLSEFQNRFSYKMSRQNYNTALRNQLTFNILNSEGEKKSAFDLILENRTLFGRPLFMSLEEVFQTNALWPIDFFGINNSEGQMVASAIFYPYTKDIVYGVFWGDNLIGRSLKSMDFLSFNLWSYYKSLGYKYIDLSTATECGIPNQNLLRFKEIHECTSSLRYKFSFNLSMRNESDISNSSYSTEA